MGGTTTDFDLRSLTGFVAAARAGAIDLEAWDDWFGCAPFKRQMEWLSGGDVARAVVIRYASDPAVFAERVGGAVRMALGEAGDVPPMRVVNATRRREHCALADDDAAWVRERYAADAELWDRVNVGDGGFRAVF